MQEKIFLKEYTTGTTGWFFDTHLSPSRSSGTQEIFPAFVIYNNQNQPIEIGTFDKEVLWRNPSTNIYEPIDNLGLNYITGGVVTRKYNYILDSSEKDAIRSRWEVSRSLFSSGQSISHIFFKEEEVEDMHIDISLHRSRDILSTLDIYNNLVNSFPIQESSTGTVFGKLVATQRIKDANGKNIRIPLRNVPIGIFNSTDEFEFITSLDENGNRIALNFKENSFVDDYFNHYSYSANMSSYLGSLSGLSQVPDQYRYITHTNENGEFVLHNIPVGVQTLFFEVDLFKQGLTKDEIALNYFPFPPDDVPNISSVPSLYFRSITIDVIPTWGTVQTGYTEVNISTELDLRKWATFYMEDISFNGLSIEELQRKGFFTPVIATIRNMGLDNFPINRLQLVEIPNLVDREADQSLQWRNEFPQLKSSAQFYTEGYHIFKLPANMYDPNGYKTDMFGERVGSKGVWLAGYQISMSYGDSASYRNTGSFIISSENGGVYRDHFNLNSTNNNPSIPNRSVQSSIGVFPYERKWDHTYPVPYRIPKIPSVPNPDFDTNDQNGKRILERPKWLDGDLIGTPFADFREDDHPLGGTGGYGVLYDVDSEVWFKSDFSKFVTKNYVFKYENYLSLNQKYGNNYIPNVDSFPVDPLISKVENGEEYQRVECGYGYWLRPEGWIRIEHTPIPGEQDVTFLPDILLQNSTISASQSDQISSKISCETTHKNSIYITNTESGKKIRLEMGDTSNVKEGGLEIYRIVDPSPFNLNSPNPSTIPTFTRFLFADFYFQRGRENGVASRLNLNIKNSGGGGGNRFWSHDGFGGQLSMSNLLLRIKNTGVVPVDIKGVRLGVDQSFDFNASILSDSDTFNNMVIELPGNDSFDYDLFQFTECSYEFEWINVVLFNSLGTQEVGPYNYTNIQEKWQTGRLEARPSNNIKNYYLVSRMTNVNTNCGNNVGANVNGAVFVTQPAQKGGIYDMIFRDGPVEITCFGLNQIPCQIT